MIRSEIRVTVTLLDSADREHVPVGIDNLWEMESEVGHLLRIFELVNGLRVPVVGLSGTVDNG